MANPNLSNNPSLKDLMNIVKSEVMETINCVQIGIIESFNPVNQTAEINLAIKKVLNGVIKETAVLIDCPVVVLSGGVADMQLPIAKGDTCLVFFCDSDIDLWWASGVQQAPATGRKHSLTDGFALVGIRNKANAISGYSANSFKLRYNNAVIELSESGIKIENGSTNVTVSNAGGVKLESASTLDITAPTINITGNVAIVGAILNNGINIGNTHTHSGVTSGTSNTGPVAS